MNPKPIRPSDILYNQMRNAKLSVKELAYLLDESYGIVYAMVRGYDKRKLRLDFAQKCAFIFKCDPTIYFAAEIVANLLENPLDPNYESKLAQLMLDLKKSKLKKKIKKGGRRWRE